MFFLNFWLHYSTFSCFQKEKCNREHHLTSPRSDLLKGLANNAICSDQESICCHQDHVIPDNDCSSYTNYTCIKKTECLDKFIESSDEGSSSFIRGIEDINPALANCPNVDDGKYSLKASKIMSGTYSNHVTYIF